jgi:hypothetical protein
VRSDVKSAAAARRLRLRPRGWILVVGMHRSGTSAVAGAVAALGLDLPWSGDLLTGREDNLVHNESESLAVFNEALLQMLGGPWSDPPTLEPGWSDDPRLARAVTHGMDTAAKAFPTDGPVVWKDPRLCLLLPFWRPLIPRLKGAVFVWRSPLAVARSLHARDGITLERGLRLWDRYNGDAIAGLTGLEVLTVNYDAVTDDPGRFVHRAAAWLDSLETNLIPDGGWRLDRARDSVTAAYRHHLVDESDVPDEYGEMVDRLVAMSGGGAVA